MSAKYCSVKWPTTAVTILSLALGVKSACTQTAPNGYTCLDEEWPWYGPIIGSLFLLVGLVFALRLRIGTWDAFGSLRCCSKDHGVEWETQENVQRRAAAPQALTGKSSVDGSEEKTDWALGEADLFNDVTDMEIFMEQFTDAELYWLATLRWLKWRWLWDVLRVVGEFLVFFKLLHMYGVDNYNMTGDISWYFVLLPFFLMDGVACGVLWQSRSYPLFYCEEYMFKAYCLFAGFPLGSAFKILLVVELESSHGVHESWFFSIVTAQFSLFLLYIVYLIFWKLKAGALRFRSPCCYCFEKLLLCIHTIDNVSSSLSEDQLHVSVYASKNVFIHMVQKCIRST
eukprot:m.634347 g.634347  ORF g.634347 m.634347 type:complete len:342 (-) comp22581_c0_seq31:4217-5242(-)